MSSSAWLIVGLGNPGNAYKQTRHNLGYEVIQAFAETKGCTFKKEERLKGWFAKFLLGDQRIILLLPATFMNLSGEAVRKTVKELGMILFSEKLLVVADDIYLPFGQMRLRQQGSHGGHNGLRSIENSLGTREYSRLRIGIEQEQENQSRADYVLERWSSSEVSALPQILHKGIEVIDTLLLSGIEAAQQRIGLLNSKRDSE